MKSRFTPKRAAASAATVALVASGAAFGSATSAVAAAPGLTITSASPVNNGGGLTPYIPVSCEVEVAFTDGTPSLPEDYSLQVFDSYGFPVNTFNGAQLVDAADPTALKFITECNAYLEREAYTLTVVEGQDSGSGAETASAPFVLSSVDHPGGISDSTVLRNGIYTSFVGKRTTMEFTGGAWEEGTTFSTRVWTSAGPEFTPNDFAANTSGGAAIVDVKDAASPRLSYTPRPRDAGRYVWTSIVGSKAGEADYQFYFNRQFVAAGTQSKALYKSFGEKRGLAKVGKQARVTWPARTVLGKQAQATATYRWFIDRQGWKPLPNGARNFYNFNKFQTGKPVKVVVTYKANGYKNMQKNFYFGKVRR